MYERTPLYCISYDIPYVRRILKDNARIIRIIGHFRRMNSSIFRLPLPLDFSVPGRCSNYTVKDIKSG